jgi:hypothetical protein
MKINDFKKLEKKINNYNFNESYKNINVIMKTLSYFGNIASIFLAFFFVSKIISGPVGSENSIFVFISSIIILSGIELLKRDLFDKFSIIYLKENTIKKSSYGLLFSTLILIFASFYSSMNGAKEFSSKSKEIEDLSKNTIENYNDSLNIVFNDKIKVFEERNNILFEQNLKIDDEMINTPSNFVSARNRLRDDKKVNLLQIEDNNNLIKELKNELNDKISEKKVSILDDAQYKINDNKSNSILFIILSTIIEFIILSGVYFAQYYNFRSYKDFRKKIEKDPNFQKWLLYDSILDILITSDTKINQKYPSIKTIIETCKANDIIVLQKDINDLTKILVGIGIVRSSGNVKYIAKNKENAKDILKNSFNID